MIRVYEATKQDRLSYKIFNDISTLLVTARKGMSYNELVVQGLTSAAVEGIIDFGISEGAFLPSYKLKNWIENTKEFFDTLPPQNILVAIYKELQKYPQGSIKGYK